MNDKKSVLIIHFFYSPISQRVMTSMSALTSRYPAQKKFGVIRALIHPWALGLAHIRVRSEKGTAARGLSRQNYRALLRNVCDSLRLLTRRFFANFLFACEAPR
jgi:hypothetical protein